MRQSTFHEGLARVERLAPGSARTFGLVFFAFFAIVAFGPLLHAKEIRLWALTLSLAVLLVALLKPALLMPLNAIWFRFGLLLHRVTNPIVLALLFFFVFTPFAILARVLRHNFLELAPEPGSDSYWKKRGPETRSTPLKDQF